MKIYLAIGVGVGREGKRRCEVLKQAGAVRALFSYADIAAKEEVPFLLPEIMLDSGAFTVATGSGIVSLESYKLWLNINLDKYPQIVTYINFDNLKDSRETLENQLSMEAEGLSPLPVYHYGEPDNILKYYCEHYEYVCLGGLAIGTMPAGSLKKFWDYVAEKYPDTKFHVLGVGTMTAFYKHQPYSVDSLTWIQNAIRGKVAGYKDGLPATADWSRSTGWEFFAEWRELGLFNARAIVDYEKLEWLENIDKKPSSGGGGQGRLF